MRRFLSSQLAIVCAALLLCVNTTSVFAGHAGDDTDCCSQATHIVVAGDNLTRIANTYGVTVAEIQAANNLSSTVIQLGQTLIIPGDLGPAEPVAPIPSDSYVVQAGDSLAKIARKFETDIETLRSLNSLQTDVLQVGQELQLPVSIGAVLTLADLPADFIAMTDAVIAPGTELEFGMLVEQSFAFISADGDQEIFGFVATPSIDHGQPISEVLLADLQAANGDTLTIAPLSNVIGERAWRGIFIEDLGFSDMLAYDIVVFEVSGKVGAVLTTSLFVTPTIPLDVEQLALTLASRVTP